MKHTTLEQNEYLTAHAERSLKHRLDRASHNKGAKIHSENEAKFKKNHPVKFAVREKRAKQIAAKAALASKKAENRSRKGAK